MKKLYIALLSVFFITPSISLASIDTNLKYGSRGAAVSELQEFLIDKGFLLGQTSGNFFSLTRKAVVAYQASVGLPATGFVGAMTRAKINAELAQDNTSATSAELTETVTTTTTQSNTAPSLVAGCASTSGFSITTGKSCSISGAITNAAVNKTITFPNGAVAEINSNGDIVRWIKEALVIPQSLNQSQISNNQVSSAVVNTNAVSTKSTALEGVASARTTTIEAPASLSVSAPAPAADPVVVYSDYNFKYQWGLYGGLNELSCPATPRNIVIKKAVFQIPASELQKISELKSVEADGLKVAIQETLSLEARRADKSRSGVFTLEEKSSNTFVYFGGDIPLCGDGGTVTIGDMSGTLTDITNQGRNVKAYLSQKGVTVDVWDNIYTSTADVSFTVRISPVMSEWEVWDYTTNKPVKIQ